MKRRLTLLSICLVAAISMSGLLLLINARGVNAAYAYDPSDLISDSIFTSKSAMSAASIQTFLNNENSGLKNYSATESCNPTKPVQPYSYTYYPHCGKKESAATLIYDAAQAYDINPQAIMATMQKEQSLITDPSPASSQLNCAMGYNSCSDFVGFFSQVDNGTWQLRTYLDLMNGQDWWGYTPSEYPCKSATSLYNNGLYPGNTVKFADPGGTAETVTIADSATAALYCYTPYVGPYSTTGYSGSYNFVQSFEQWWGSTVYEWAGDVTVTAYEDSARTQQYSSLSGLASGTKIYVTVSAINTGSKTWKQSSTEVATEDPNNRTSVFKDSSWLSSNRAAQLMQSSVAPGQTGTFEFSLTTPNVDGQYNEGFGLVEDGSGGGWMQDNAAFSFDITVSNPYNGTISQLSTYRDSGYSEPTDSGEMTYGEKVYVEIKAKNIGSDTWSNSFTKVATEDPNNRTSVFSNNSWSSSDRPTGLMQSSVAPGQTGTFEFSITAPSTAGTYNESFGLVADGQSSGWMPAATFSLPITVFDPPLDTMDPGIVLYSGQALESKDENCTLTMQADGNLVLRNDISGAAVWASGTQNSPGAYLEAQTDGNLVVRNENGAAVWNSHTEGNSITQLNMQTDGNLVLRNSNGKAIWASDTVQPDLAATNTNSIHSPNGLGVNQSISSGSYRLTMQSDGNLVLRKGSAAVWSSKTSGNSGANLTMQSDGNLVIRNTKGKAVWSSKTNGHGFSVLMLQSNGDLAIYDSKSHVTWSAH